MKALRCVLSIFIQFYYLSLIRIQNCILQNKINSKSYKRNESEFGIKGISNGICVSFIE